MIRPAQGGIGQGFSSAHQAVKLPDGVLIDAEDSELVSTYNTWFISKRGDVYSQQWNKGKATTYKLHRVIMTPPENRVVDHINGNPLDNRRSNLRICTSAENSRNLKRQSNNTSGFPGVSWDKSRNKWAAKIRFNYKHINLGRYVNLSDAVKARERAEIEYFGEFSSLGRRDSGTV